MKIEKIVSLLALGGMCFSASACATNSTPLVPITGGSGCAKIIETVIVTPPPPPKMIKYVCGRCRKQYKPTTEFPYCPECFPPEQIVVVQPPVLAAPAPAPVAVYQPVYAQPTSIRLFNGMVIHPDNFRPSSYYMLPSIHIQHSESTYTSVTIDNRHCSW